jgi:nitroreductase/NAD-dependent dihydropyrimidine dehydrogenase PreA subunit
MPFTFEIDADKCTGCGLCVKECVSGTIQPGPDRPRAANPDWCNRCSHCLAVCPTGAIGHGGLAGRQEARPVERRRLDPEVYREIVLSRRSVRHFRDEPVPREELEDILAVASYSPTASNTLDVGYTVITDRALIDSAARRIFADARKIKGYLDRPWVRALLSAYARLTGQDAIMGYIDRFEYFDQQTVAGRDLIAHHAPVLIVIHAPRKGRFNDANCHIAAANLTNYAHAKGLGTCYLGLVVVALGWSKKLAARLGVPPGRRAFQVLALGRPAHKFANIASRPPATVEWK